MADPNHSDETSLEDKKYQNPELRKVDVPQAPTAAESKEMQEVRKKLDGLKKYINKKELLHKCDLNKGY